MGVINHLLLALFMSQMEMFGSNAIEINIDPARTIATMAKSIQISCLPRRLDVEKKEVTLIKLSRNDQDPLVFARQCGNVSFGHDSSNKFQGFGNIDKDRSQSYLNVSLLNPESQDTGIYTCTLYYIDKEGHMKMETASGNLLVEKIDVKSLEKVLNQMGDEIASLDKKNKKFSEKITSLDEKISDKFTSLEKENKAFQEKVFYTVAFMATTKNHLTPSRGAVVILPDIIWSTGTGYDNQTGVFTAPVPGLYAFHVVLRSSHNCHQHLDLMVNEKILSRFYSYDKDSWPQNSISSVISLQAEDRVFIIMRPGQGVCKIHDNLYSVFTGYLLKVL